MSDNLLGDPSASGKVRERAVQISGGTYLPIDNTLSSLVEKLNLNPDDSKKILEILELKIASLHERNIVRYQIHPREFSVLDRFEINN